MLRILQPEVDTFRKGGETMQMVHDLIYRDKQAISVEDKTDLTRKLRNHSSSNNQGEVLFNRLIVVSNRLPITVNKNGAGELEVMPSSGGLVTALSPVLRDTRGLWIGWPGATTPVNLDGHLHLAGKQLGCTFEPVVLSEEELGDYYLGFSNQILWPLFHNFPEFCKLDLGYWQTYQEVNRKFAHVVAQLSSDNDYVWVQDYHLLLLARELRDVNVKRQTGFFLHTPFPPLDTFWRLPWRIQIIRAMLDYDLVGFQTQRDRDNFLECVEESIAGLHYEDNGGLIVVNSPSRKTTVGAFPISIDFSDFETLAMSGQVEERARQIRQAAPDCQIVLGVDRLDYSKGIPLRLRAYRTFLERFKELHGKVTMTQIVVPSRDKLPEYQAVKTEIEHLVAEINNEFSDQNWVPIQYIYGSLDRPELVAYYRAADIALVTPIRDGMNLIAKEFCAASVDNRGVLVLSKFAGAAHQMRREALIINPHDIDSVVEAIYQAYHMPTDERRTRMQRLRQSVSRQDIHWWSNLFLERAKEMAF
jgi:alpha,alpha-trehalose-phosphate synthase [UDP-forming]